MFLSYGTLSQQKLQLFSFYRDIQHLYFIDYKLKPDFKTPNSVVSQQQWKARK